jgi:hypothetical protein
VCVLWRRPRTMNERGLLKCFRVPRVNGVVFKNPNCVTICRCTNERKW